MFEAILQHYVTVFTTKFVTDLEKTDPLRMKVVQKFPFHDDPTRECPYLIFDYDQDKGFYVDKDSNGSLPYMEISGSQPWRVNLMLKAGPKVQKKAEDAYSLLDKLTLRCLWSIQNDALSSYTLLNTARVENRDWMIIDRVEPHIFGGDNEWLSYVKIWWHVTVKIPYLYGEFPV